ncbi:MAG: sodium:solute symporter family protein [Thermoanaerobaculaceae bacterium]|nr:sodium:solute symporter family protein [Thermoanaerobaculaceae bacterium]MDI9621295.1 sodium:solute symporter family protein [Acidobacteriota bacterium]NLH09807.1 sodium:solute symporter family protein [Holophagae bacterium]HPW54173.1 sodium:solute symporter family protein [Thermoanaerobaculaceae bacterium]
MSLLHPIDGAIVGLYLLGTMVAGVLVRRHVSKVEHFLLAGREMDVALGVASLAATEFGIVTCVYTAQNGFKYGFAGATPGILNAVAMLVVGLTGFCIEPLREAGVVTLPELFERRFGPRVRAAAAVVMVLGGLLNMGVFLRTGGEFLLTVTGAGTGGSGSWARTHTLELAMTALLLLVGIYTVLGGMLSVLVTDFLQFVVMSAGLLVVTVLVLARVGWTNLVVAVERYHGAGGFNPLVNPEMGWAYVLFNACLNLAVVLTWMAVIQRVLAARDTKTGRKVFVRTSFFFVTRFLIPGIWGIAALALLGPGVDSLQAMPRFLAHFVPVGIMGLLLAAMLAADMSTDSSYMLTWASLIYNDLLARFRRRSWGDREGLRVNRLIVAAIGVFLLWYGLWYPLKGDLWTYLGVTGTIYLASMSTLLVACCYWRRASPTGAAAAIVAGAVIPVAYLVLEQLPATAAFARTTVGPYWSGLAAYAASALAMMVGSWLRPAKEAS